MTLSNAFRKANTRFKVVTYTNGRASNLVNRFRDGTITNRRVLSAISLWRRGLFCLFSIRERRRSYFVCAIRGLQPCHFFRRKRCLFLHLFGRRFTVLIVGLFRLTLGMYTTRIKDRSSGYVLRICHASLIIDRASIVRGLRRGVRRVKVYFFCFVGRCREM